MALLSVRGVGGVREGLTLYQVQHLVQTGVLSASDEVLLDGVWLRIDASPRLAPLLRANLAPAAAPAAATVRVEGLDLEQDPEGRPRLPPAEVVRELLAAEAAADRPSGCAWKLLLTLGLAFVGGEVAYVMWLAFGP